MDTTVDQVSVTDNLEVTVKVTRPKTKTLTLSDGRTAVIRTGKGREVVEAQKQMGTDTSKFMSVITALLTSIDGQSVVFEDLLELEMIDYMQIQQAVAELNFTLLESQNASA